MSRTQLIEHTDNYKLQLETEQGVRFLHCDVVNWSRKIREEILEKVEGLKPFLAYSKNPKFCIAMGGEYVHTIGDYEVFLWD